MSDDWFVCADGSRLRVAEEGDLAAPVTVVLVHCYMLDLHEWDPLMHRFATACRNSVRVVRYDLRGHGGSDAIGADDATLGGLGDDLAELIEHRVPFGPVVLVGHSMGGMVIMAMADRHPELVADRVAGVAFIATAASDMGTISLGLPGPVATLAHGVERVGVGVLDALGLTELPRQVLRPLLLQRVTQWLSFGASPRQKDVAAVARIAARCRPSTLNSLRRSFDEHDCRLALITFDGLPAVVVVGDLDRLTPVRHAAVITEWLPTARLVVFPGAGHMVIHERTDRLVDLLAELTADALTAWTRRSWLAS